MEGLSLKNRRISVRLLSLVCILFMYITLSILNYCCTNCVNSKERKTHSLTVIENTSVFHQQNMILLTISFRFRTEICFASKEKDKIRHDHIPFVSKE